jgi:hypothetical protein
MKRSWLCSICGILLGLLLIIGLPTVVSQGIKAGVRGNVIIDTPEAKGFRQFRNKSFGGSSYMEFYFFNITNPHHVLKGQKPVLEEIGPFVYDQSQIREDFKWSWLLDTLSYRQHSEYQFNRAKTLELSNGKYSTDKVPITTMNLVFSGLKAAVGEKYLWEACEALGWRSELQRVFTTRLVIEMLHGYQEHVAILPHLGEIPVSYPGLFPNVSKTEDPSWKHKSTMKVGALNSDDAYELVSWMDMEEIKAECPWGTNPLSPCDETYPCCKTDTEPLVPVWGTALDNSVWDIDANRVHGHYGEQFSPGLKEGQDLIVFSDQVSRALRFVNRENEEVEFRGIKMLRFTPEDASFMNASEHPSNARYYHFGPRGFLANLTRLRQGAEVYISLPHFLGGDPSLVENVVGLNPDRNKHMMHIDVEPTLGQTMVAHARGQINTALHSEHHRGVTYVPIAWFDIASELSEKSAEEFKQIYIAETVEVVSIVIGLSVLLLSVILLLLLACTSARVDECGLSEYDNCGMV